MVAKVLFILKRREDYNDIAHSPKGLSTGLYNSAMFVNSMLNHAGIVSELEVAIDNNCIDRLVNQHKPTHVIIEALWVVPSKFAELSQLHPEVTWIIRLHSEMPFMAGEGIAMDWLGDYADHPNIVIACNAPRMLGEVMTYLQIAKGWDGSLAEEKVVYLPNYYPQIYKKKTFDKTKPYIDISCFGAVRLLKNHMLQAVAALEFAQQIGKKLRFHINIGRVEMEGNPVMHNLLAFFQQLADSGHQLIGHEWTPRDRFLEVCKDIDIALQCNFSETFNIVSADHISQGVPIVGTDEIPWSSYWFNAHPGDSQDIAYKLHRTYMLPGLNVWINQRNLTKYTNETQKIWVEYFGEYYE